MDTRALKRLSLWTGIIVLLTALVLVRRVHTEERALELVLIIALAVGAFLTISGIVGVLTEPPRPAPEENDEATIGPVTGRPISVTTAVGIYLLVLAVIAGVVVGIASDDVGAGVQTFTFGLILGAVVWGLGLLLGYRPVEE